MIAENEKEYLIVQTRIDGDVALTKADTFETTNNALKRYKIMEIPQVKIMEKKEWMKSPERKKKRSPGSKKAKKALDIVDRVVLL